MTAYKGVLTFHSETGTEGGHWAFQDEKFMGIKNSSRVCTRCGRVWGSDQKDEPKPFFTYWVEDPRPNYHSGYRSFDEPQDLPVSRGEDDKFNANYTKHTNATALACHQSGHAGWKPMYPQGMWSYEGLHILHNGDHLTIYDVDNPKKVIWEGVINLKQFDLFTEDAQGLWIHADQKGIDRQTWSNWFFKEYPARLMTNGRA